MMRVGLVGCVKTKLATPAPARNLYVSPLFLGRRRYVEESCERWFVLSAEHGLVAPHDVLEPYDKTLNDASVGERRRWASTVLDALLRSLGDPGAHVFEIHAGTNYTSFGLVEGLRARGAKVDLPAVGLPLGRQLAFYRAAGE